MKTKTPLKPCPFCGGSKAEVVDGICDGLGRVGFAVVCGNTCGISPVRKSRAIAVKAWNKRVGGK